MKKSSGRGKGNLLVRLEKRQQRLLNLELMSEMPKKMILRRMRRKQLRYRKLGIKLINSYFQVLQKMIVDLNVSTI